MLSFVSARHYGDPKSHEEEIANIMKLIRRPRNNVKASQFVVSQVAVNPMKPWISEAATTCFSNTLETKSISNQDFVDLVTKFMPMHRHIQINPEQINIARYELYEHAQDCIAAVFARSFPNDCVEFHNHLMSPLQNTEFLTNKFIGMKLDSIDTIVPHIFRNSEQNTLIEKLWIRLCDEDFAGLFGIVKYSTTFKQAYESSLHLGSWTRQLFSNFASKDCKINHDDQSFGTKFMTAVKAEFGYLPTSYCNDPTRWKTNFLNQARILHDRECRNNSNEHISEPNISNMRKG